MKLRSLGDTVLMTAPLTELKRAFPGAEIHVAVSAAWAPLLESHPAISKVWIYERRSERAARAKSVAGMALRLRREHFDCVVNFHASPSSATIAFATGAKTRSIHFHGHKDKNRYSTVPVPGKGVLKPIIERDMDTVRALGIHVPAGRMPEIHLRAAEKAQAAQWLERLGLGSPRLMIGLGASRPTKSWPVERFASLALQWVREQKGSVLALAGPDEAEEVRRFLKNVDELLTAELPDSSGRAVIRSRIAAECELPIRQLAGLLAGASVYVGNDSGPKHVAVAVGTPTVTVFGPEHPFEWHPYPLDDHPYLFVESLACRRDALPGMPPWCGLGVCAQHRHQCMRMIGVEPVLSECRRLSARGSGGP